MPQSEIHELETMRANALAIVRSCDSRIKLLGKPEKKVNKKVIAGTALAKERNEKRYRTA